MSKTLFMCCGKLMQKAEVIVTARKKIQVYRCINPKCNRTHWEE